MHAEKVESDAFQRCDALGQPLLRGITASRHYFSVARCRRHSRNQFHVRSRFGRTRFYVLTTNGVRTLEAPENSLGYDQHALSPLFHACHEVISGFREAEERRRQPPLDGL